MLKCLKFYTGIEIQNRFSLKNESVGVNCGGEGMNPISRQFPH